jgi:hypothetical protein
VFFNEQQFILCYRNPRNDNALSISRVYSTAPLRPDEAERTMMELSYFLAHAMCGKFPTIDTQGAPELEQRAATTNNQTAMDFTAATVPSSVDSSGSGNSTASGFSAMANLASRTLRSMMMPSCLMPSSLTFVTWGKPSPPLSLRPFKTEGDKFRSSSTGHLILNHMLDSRNQVWQGLLGDLKVFAKLAVNCESADLLHEYAVYEKLVRIQGTAIPRCLGLFHIEDFAFLLLTESCGASIHSFTDLNPHQR